MKNKKLTLATQLGYVSTIYGWDIFQIPDTNDYIQIDDDLKVTNIFKEN